MKKVLILVENLPVPFDRRVWMEATALTEAGYKVSVICPKGDYRQYFEILNGVHIYRYPLPSLNGVAGHLLEYGIAVPVTFLLSWVVLLHQGFDVIQSANPPDFFFMIGGFFKLFGKKFVFDHHDLVPESCETRWTGPKLTLMRAISVWAEKATFRVADRVIATNQSYREIALTRGRLPASKVTVVRSGPSLTRFQMTTPRPELKNGRTFLVCYLGVMGPNDGLDYLLRAINIIVHKMQRSDIQFILVGGGDLQPVLAAMSRKLELGDFVQFTGRIPDEAVIELLSAADICVAPDPKDPLNDVSTMNKIIEYMAMSKPIVAFDLREARVSAGSAAVYAAANNVDDFAQKIVELLGCKEKRTEMGRVGRQRFETELAWEHQRVHLLALYQDLFS